MHHETRHNNSKRQQIRRNPKKLSNAKNTNDPRPRGTAEGHWIATRCGEVSGRDLFERIARHQVITATIQPATLIIGTQQDALHGPQVNRRQTMRPSISDKARNLLFHRHSALQFCTAARTTTNTPRPSPPSVTD
jgi:hypothetical protein